MCRTTLALISLLLGSAPLVAGELFIVGFEFSSGDERLLSVHPASGALSPIGSGISSCCAIPSTGASGIDEAGGRVFFIGDESGTRKIFSLALGNGAVLDDPALPTGNNYIFLDYDPPSGSLYTIYNNPMSAEWRLATVNPDTGALGNVGAVFSGCCSSNQSATLDPASGVFYAVMKAVSESDWRLYGFSLDTGAIVSNPRLPTGNNYLFLEWDPSSGKVLTLYRTGSSSGQLASINPATGALTSIGPAIAACCNSPAGPLTAIDPGADTFYAIGTRDGESQRRLFALSASSGTLHTDPFLSTNNNYNFLQHAVSAIFSDGFESGDTSAWSVTNP